MKKKGGLLVLLFSLFVINLPVVFANPLLDRVWDRVIWIGQLGFLGIPDASIVTGFTRILITLLVFTIFFAVTTAFSGDGNALGFLSRGQAGIVSAIVAIITAIFIPASVLLAVGSGWATAVAFLLIGGPVAGLFYILWNVNTWMGLQANTRGSAFLKLILCILLFWILSAVKYHVGLMGTV